MKKNYEMTTNIWENIIPVEIPNRLDAYKCYQKTLDSGKVSIVELYKQTCLEIEKAVSKSLFQYNFRYVCESRNDYDIMYNVIRLLGEDNFIVKALVVRDERRLSPKTWPREYDIKVLWKGLVGQKYIVGGDEYKKQALEFEQLYDSPDL